MHVTLTLAMKLSAILQIPVLMWKRVALCQFSQFNLMGFIVRLTVVIQ